MTKSKKILWLMLAMISVFILVVAIIVKPYIGKNRLIKKDLFRIELLKES